jgi:hypothetical protein
MELPYWLQWQQVSHEFCCAIDNPYAKIKMKILSTVVTPLSTKKKAPHFIFETSLLELCEENA